MEFMTLVTTELTTAIHGDINLVSNIKFVPMFSEGGNDRAP